VLSQKIFEQTAKWKYIINIINTEGNDMTALLEKVYALDLTTDDSLKLVDRLLQSVNLPTQEDIDKAWSKEVDTRSERLENDKTKLIPREEVFAKLKSQFATR
jgi:putative addiction module component (TIGR02574 family)